jgi:hypothetical protein
MQKDVKEENMSKIVTFNPQEEDELVPIELWDGECWKTMFETLHEMAPNSDPWDLLAQFIKLTLIKGDAHVKGHTN